ncbi:MAG: TusE/DsrC/DsvC family sulfur relay protein [Methylotetracoccus sp.]|jgi:tRNA 2-thiouridine synthesizing protein E|nr:TusE/DsrC/DsvC family sulfur relay protein [Methylotetracoccus sp.]
MSGIEFTAIRTTEQGFLCDYNAWDETVAQELAGRIPLELTEAHWEIVHFIRGYYLRYRHLPNMRMFVKAVQKNLGDDKGNSRYLYRLFPDGPLKQACLVAGLPKPPSCL